jgi:regulatory protein
MAEENAAIYNAALSLLARREHSALELERKLLKKFGPSQRAAIQTCLQQLQENGYQSDSRYTEIYLRSRSQQGYGIGRIAQELKIKGINTQSLTQNARTPEQQQEQKNQLHKLWQKKFGRPPQDAKEKHKQLQFLIYRGYSPAHITALFEVLKTPLEDDLFD